jgi:hypothetical protein
VAEIVQFGSPRRPGRRWVSRLLLACLIATALVLALYHPARHHAALPPAVSVTNLGHPILGVSANWELFGLTSTGLVSVQFARGQITRTVLPPPEGDGWVTLLVGQHQAIVRPLDNVPGYVVADGQPARQLTGILARGALLLPGPRPDEEWDIGSRPAITLVGPGGTATGLRLSALSQRYPAQSALSDGRGNVVLFGNSGSQFDASPGSVRPVGALLVAVGPRNWLGLSCRRGHCRNVVIDGATGARRTLPGTALDVVTWPWPAEPGVVAPDGLLAAVTVGSGAQGTALDLVNLSTGSITTIRVPVGTWSSSQTLAWSPDSRWLFVIAASGKLVAVSARTGRTQALDAPLPGLTQIAVRSG